MFALSKTASHPSLPPAPAESLMLPPASVSIGGLIAPCTASALDDRQISRETATPQMTGIAEHLSGKPSKKQSQSPFILDLEGMKHLTPWKRDNKLQFVNVFDAATPLTELSVKDPVDIDLIGHYIKIRQRSLLPGFQKAYPMHHTAITSLDRYVGVIPYKHNCIALKNGQYINASLVDGVVSVIITQAPIPASKEHPGTYADFWQMVWEKECRDIVMLNYKPGEEYWPAQLNQPVAFGNIEVVMINEALPQQGTVHRTFLIKNKETGELREVAHRQMTDWLDRAVPTKERLLSFLYYCRHTVYNGPFVAGPLVVHCNFGAGRSGTFVLLYNILSLLWSLPADTLDAQHVLNFPSWLLWMRSCRANAVSEDSQMVLIYEIVRHITKQLTDSQ